jgi:hypothetical protein
MSLRSCGLRSLSDFHFFHSFFFLSSSLFATRRNEGRRSAGGAQVVACHPSRRAMTGTEAPALSGRLAFVPTRGRNARLSALRRGDLCTPARAPRCSGFPPGSCGDRIRRIGSYCPEDRVLGPPRGTRVETRSSWDSHGPGSALRDRLAKAPLMSQAETTCGRFAGSSQDIFSNCSHMQNVYSSTTRAAWVRSAPFSEGNGMTYSTNVS